MARTKKKRVRKVKVHGDKFDFDLPKPFEIRKYTSPNYLWEPLGSRRNKIPTYFLYRRTKRIGSWRRIPKLTTLRKYILENAKIGDQKEFSLWAARHGLEDADVFAVRSRVDWRPGFRIASLSDKKIEELIVSLERELQGRARKEF